jgi:hypothetical protein
MNIPLLPHDIHANCESKPQNWCVPDGTCVLNLLSRRQQSFLCLYHKRARGGGICSRSHPWMGWSLEGCECIIWIRVKLKWRFVKVYWENVLCVG